MKCKWSHWLSSRKYVVDPAKASSSLLCRNVQKWDEFTIRTVTYLNLERLRNTWIHYVLLSDATPNLLASIFGLKKVKVNSTRLVPNIKAQKLVTLYLNPEFSQSINPITVPRCPEGTRKLRFPDYVRVNQDGGKVATLTHRPLFTPGKCCWYSFLLEPESTTGPLCDWKVYVNEKFQWRNLESN